MLLLRTLSELFMLRRLLQLLVLQWQILLQAPPVQAIINDNRSGPFGPPLFLSCQTDPRMPFFRSTSLRSRSAGTTVMDNSATAPSSPSVSGAVRNIAPPQ